MLLILGHGVCAFMLLKQGMILNNMIVMNHIYILYLVNKTLSLLKKEYKKNMTAINNDVAGGKRFIINIFVSADDGSS